MQNLKKMFNQFFPRYKISSEESIMFYGEIKLVLLPAKLTILFEISHTQVTKALEELKREKFGNLIPNLWYYSRFEINFMHLYLLYFYYNIYPLMNKKHGITINIINKGKEKRFLKTFCSMS